MAKPADHSFSQAMTIAGESMTPDGQIPLERLLAKHWPVISAWRTAGWTWRQIAALLTKARIRLKDGDPVTDKYLAAVASRLNRVQIAAGQDRPNINADRRVGKPLPPTPDSPDAIAPKLLTPKRVGASVGEPTDDQNRRDEIRARMQRAAKTRGRI